MRRINVRQCIAGRHTYLRTCVGACASGEEWEVKLRDASDVKEDPQGRPRSTGKRVTGRE